MTDQDVATPTPSPNTAGPRLRISTILEQRKEQEGSYNKLAKAIDVAIKLAGRAAKDGGLRRLDRRKLKDIVDNDPTLVLSIGELRALDLYLEQFGHGLAYNPFFEKPDVIRCLAASGRIAFLLGSKQDPAERFRINISHWDFLGMNYIQSGVLACSQGVNIDHREIRMPANLKAARSASTRSGGFDPSHELFSSEGPSLVVLGSSRGTHLAEWLLCRMAGVEVFKRGSAKTRDELPFHFVWSKNHQNVFPSAFHLEGKDVQKENPDAADAVLERDAACLRYGGRYLIDDLTRGRDEGYTYAVCAAQRRKKGQVWLLVAGLTGPATAAGARWVEKMATTIYDSSQAQSPVFWNIVRAHAVKDQDTFEVGEPEFVAGGEAWG